MKKFYVTSLIFLSTVATGNIVSQTFNTHCLPACSPEKIDRVEYNLEWEGRGRGDCYLDKRYCLKNQVGRQVAAPQEPRTPTIALSIQNASGKFDVIQITYIDKDGFARSRDIWTGQDFPRDFTKCFSFDSSVMKITSIAIWSQAEMQRELMRRCARPNPFLALFGHTPDCDKVQKETESRIEVGGSKCDLGELQSPNNSAVHFKVNNDAPGGKNRILFADECRDCSQAQ